MRPRVETTLCVTGGRLDFEAIGAALGIGYGNAKQFLRRLNHYGVTRSEWEAALADLDEEN